jgi:N-acetylglucosaminyldiphosphoundecaprenol N-acetyl-beta-D-mannosaminyltransferase
MSFPRINVLGVPVDSITLEQAVDAVVTAAQTPGLAQAAFVNADCMNISYQDAVYRRLLQTLPLVFADGSGIRYASRMLGTPVRDNVNGTDLFPLICERAVDDQLPLYFLGAKPGVTDRLVARLRHRYPGIPVAGWHHGYFTAEQEPDVVREIAQSGAKILFVAFGAPRQDLWIDAHHETLGVNLALGVGGLFDFAARGVERAPLWMRSLGFEWVFRLLQEPGRLVHRYLVGNPLFLWRTQCWARQQKNH